MDDYNLFTSAKKAKDFWDMRVKWLKKEKYLGLGSALLCLFAYTPVEDHTGIMDPSLIATYYKANNDYDKNKPEWEEFVKEAKGK